MLEDTFRVTANLRSAYASALGGEVINLLRQRMQQASGMRSSQHNEACNSGG